MAHLKKHGKFPKSDNIKGRLVKKVPFLELQSSKRNFKVPLSLIPYIVFEGIPAWSFLGGKSLGSFPSMNDHAGMHPLLENYKRNQRNESFFLLKIQDCSGMLIDCCFYSFSTKI